MLLTNDLGIWIQIKQHKIETHGFLNSNGQCWPMHGIQKQCPNKYLPILQNSSKVVDSQNIWKKGIRKKKQRRFY